MTSLPLGTIIVLLFLRALNRGRSRRDFRGFSFSVSDDELVDDGGLATPSARGLKDGSGIGGVVWLTGSDTSGAILAGCDAPYLVVY